MSILFSAFIGWLIPAIPMVLLCCFAKGISNGFNKYRRWKYPIMKGIK